MTISSNVKCTPDSITKSECELNIKSVQEDEFLGRHVGSLISWYNSPNLEFMLCIFELSYDVFSLLHQRFDSTLKSLITTVKNGLFAKIV